MTSIPGVAPEHAVELRAAELPALRAWLEHPAGAHTAGGISFDAVTDGGILIRTRRTTSPPANIRASVRAALRDHTTGNLVVLVGPPGSGKSTLAGEIWEPDQVLSLDALRRVISGDECDQSATPDAVAALHALTAARLSRQLTTVIDATNVNARFREPLLAIARDHDVPATALVVSAPLAVCLARNSTRPGPQAGQRWGRRVPGDVIRAHHQMMTASLPALRAEGFAQVIVYDGALDWQGSAA